MKFDFFFSNIKFSNLKTFKTNFFPGIFINNYKIYLLNFNNKEKKIVDQQIVLDCIDRNYYNLKNYNFNSFLMYSEGSIFVSNTIFNKNIFFLTPFKKGYFANIFTTIISIKTLNEIAYKQNDNFENCINKNYEVILKKIFKTKLKNDEYNYFYINYIKIFIDLEDNFKKSNDEYYILLKIIQTDIKINFLINLIFKFKSDFTSDDLILFYDFIYLNLENINKITSHNINSYFNSNIIELNETFDKIIKNWFIYIDLCEKSIRLCNCVNVIYNKTIGELIEDSENINKNQIIDSILNLQRKNMFKIVKTLLE